MVGWHSELGVEPPAQPLVILTLHTGYSKPRSAHNCRQPNDMWLLEKVTGDLFALAIACVFLKQSSGVLDKNAADMERRGGLSAKYL